MSDSEDRDIEARRASLAARLRGAASDDSAIPRASRAGLLPLSFAQERMWFLHQYQTAGPAHNCPVPIRLSGPLDHEALVRAIELIVTRHEPLRTRFRMADGEPVQEIYEPGPVALAVEDLSELAAEQRAGELARLTRQFAREPIDLAAGPPARFLLVRLADEAHTLVLNVHHIVWDGWSRGVFVRELGQAYAEFTQGREPALAELPVQHADYAVWQREELQGERLQRLVTWWREYLAGAPPTSEMPTDRPRQAELTHAGARVTFRVPSELSDAVRELGQSSDCTLFMTLLAAWGVLMHRYTGQDDLLIGGPVAGRMRVELEDLIGYFINTLVFRLDISGDPDVAELLGRVREAALGAHGHQELPFERLVDEVVSSRDPSRTPLFQVIFQTRNFPRAEAEVGDLRAEVIECDAGTAKLDLNVEITDQPDGFAGLIEYNTDLFDEATAQRMARHFTNVLVDMTESADLRVSQLELLSEAERLQTLVEWAQNFSDYPRDACVPELFDQQAAATPDAVAARDGDAELTYRELRERANRLAHCLQARGVEPGDRVGILLPRCLDILAATLATVKAGAAYVPLDPDHPAQRLQWMLADAGVAAVVTLAELSDQIPDLAGRALCLDRDAEEIAACSAESPAVDVAGTDLAYVMYTSGSTGRPKGVAVPHRAVLRLVVNADYLQLGPGDVVPQIASFGFDAATLEVWGPLLNGGTVALIPREVVLDPVALCERLRAEGVTAMFMTSALFNTVAADAPDGLAGIGTVIVGGDAVEAHSVARVLEAGPPDRLLNGYGPTENTTFSTWHEVTGVAPGAVTVPIGRPIANSTAYIFDGQRHPVPVGVTGELYVGGDGLADGYWRQPELTAESFVTVHIGNGRAERLYRTGDLARYLADGSIEWVGRVDDQVKIRGHRIEPAEVRAAVQNHPAVEVTEAELREFLARSLPRVMVPTHIAMLTSLPLSGNGKVDRDALPEPAWGKPLASESRVAPRDGLEDGLRRVWERVLGVSEIGVTDDFFELGGHSLLAARLLAEIEAELGVVAPLSSLFLTPTVEGLAGAMRAATGAAAHPRILELRSGRCGPTLFMPHIRPHLPAGYRGLMEALAEDLNLSVLHDPSRHREMPAGLEIGNVAASFVADLRQAQPAGPYFLAGFCVDGVLAWEMACQLERAGCEVAMLALLEARIPGTAPSNASLRGRLEIHLANVRGGGLPGASRYVFERAVHTLRSAAGAALRRRGSGELVRELGRMQQRYRPRRYAGHVHILRSVWLSKYWDEPADLGWAAFADGTVETHQSDTEHRLLARRDVGELAAYLSDCVHRAAATADGQGGG